MRLLTRRRFLRASRNVRSKSCKSSRDPRPISLRRSLSAASVASTESWSRLRARWPAPRARDVELLVLLARAALRPGVRSFPIRDLATRPDALAPRRGETADMEIACPHCGAENFTIPGWADRDRCSRCGRQLAQ